MATASGTLSTFALIRYGIVCLLALLACVTSCTVETAEAALSRGNRYYQEGKYADAAIAYRKAIRKNIRLGEAHYRYALALIAQTHAEKAITPLRRALTLMPDHEDAGVQLGNIYLSQWLKNPRRPRQLYDEMHALAERVLARHPQSAGALRQAGYLALHRGERDKAADYFEKALAVRPHEPDVTVALAQLRSDSEPQRSETMLTDLLRKHSGFSPGYDALYALRVKQHRTADAEQVLISKRRALPGDATAVLQLAGHYLESGRQGEAQALLEDMLANGAAFPDRYLLIGDFHALRRNYAEAVRVYSTGADASPRDRSKYDSRIAKLLLTQHKTDEAIGVVESAIRRDGNDADARAIRAGIWLQSGKPEMVRQGVQEMEALVKAHPENALFHYTLASAYLANGNRTAARSHARDAARYDQALAPARIMVAEIDLADKRPRDALPYVVEALEIDPFNSRARLLLVRALQLTGRIADAKTELELLLKAAPNYRDAQIQLGYMQIDQQRHQDAEATFRRLLRPGQDDVDAMGGLVQVLFIRNQRERALQELKAEVARSARATRMKLLLADVALRSGEPDVALQQYTGAMAAGIRNAEVYSAAAAIHYRNGRLAEAVYALRQAVAIAPERTDLAVSLGAMIEQDGQQAEARAIYRNALRTDPQNATAMNNLAYNLAEAGENLDEAISLATQASRLRSNPDFTDTLGWIYLKKNMTDTAVQIFRNLVDKDPKNATFRMHLGMALLAGGDRSAARKQLEQALENNPPSRQADQIRNVLNRTRL